MFAILVKTTYHIFGIDGNHCSDRCHTVTRLAMMIMTKMLMLMMMLLVLMMTTHHLLPIPSESYGAVARVPRPRQEPQRLPTPEFTRIQNKILDFELIWISVVEID